jgi:hypothetical protein
LEFGIERIVRDGVALTRTHQTMLRVDFSAQYVSFVFGAEKRDHYVTECRPGSLHWMLRK